MQVSQTTEQIEAPSSVQANCEIQAVALQSCTVVRAKTGTDFKEPFSVRPALSNIASSHHDSLLAVEVSFEYAAWDSGEPSQRLFAVNCTFEVVYHLKDGYTPGSDELNSFSRGTAVFNCWPFAREFLRDVTARIGHQTPVLPLLRIVPKKPETGVTSAIEASPIKDQIEPPTK
ncbi:hypothetical protein SBA4_4800018 [Candidatus Sulfopaludibacter sp. SbA4]|nr:hypothetical protein SBA4_4800018 [Candidatus Sulfopaludibacter sp. SbA4]